MLWRNTSDVSDIALYTTHPDTEGTERAWPFTQSKRTHVYVKFQKYSGCDYK